MHSDGEMFWRLSHGINAPEGGLAMPGFAAVLSDDQRWALIDIIRADDAGTTRSGTGNWAFPVQAPDFEAACDGRVVDPHDFQGQVVRLGISRSNPVTVQADPDTKAARSRECEGEDATAAAAYALVSGIPARDLPGSQFLIDDQGWLRAVRRPAQAGRGDDPDALAAVIDDLRRHPVAASGSGGMIMPR